MCKSAPFIILDVLFTNHSPSLQAAMDLEATTSNCLDPHRLELGTVNPLKSKVDATDPYPKFQQPLTYGGMKLMIQVLATKLPSLI